MRPSWRMLVVVAVLAGAAPVLALPEPDEDDLARNRALLEKFRADPEHYSRLRRDWKAFHALPPDKQAHIRELDHELHHEYTDTQARLWRVLERYAAWLERLPEAEQRRLETAGSEERLRLIQELRVGEWVARLPRATRDEVQNTPAERRPALIAQLRDRERQRRQEWQRAQRRPQPVKLADFPGDVQTFVTESLHPLLSNDERLRLRLVEGQWPLYGQTLVELSDRHPLTMPPSPMVGPRTFKDLKELKQKLPARMLDKTKQESAEGRWPDFALYLTEVARARNIAIPPLGPSNAREFYPAVTQFIEKQLVPKLDAAERERLKAAEGLWPEYPKLIMDLSRKHSLRVPGTTLPGPRELWDNLRKELPEVSDRVLRDFALTQLTSEDLADLQLSWFDPASRDRLRVKLFEKNPRELQRLRRLDAEVHIRKLKGRPQGLN